MKHAHNKWFHATLMHLIPNTFNITELNKYVLPAATKAYKDPRSYRLV